MGDRKRCRSCPLHRRSRARKYRHTFGNELNAGPTLGEELRPLDAAKALDMRLDIVGTRLPSVIQDDFARNLGGPLGGSLDHISIKSGPKSLFKGLLFVLIPLTIEPRLYQISLVRVVLLGSWDDLGPDRDPSLSQNVLQPNYLS